MRTVTEIFERAFVLTGDNVDPKNLDFTFYTSEIIISNQDGTPAVKQYYLNYDPVGGVFRDLAVQSTFTYTYNADGILVMRVEDIQWFFDNGDVGTTRQATQVYQTV